MVKVENKKNVSYSDFLSTGLRCPNDPKSFLQSLKTGPEQCICGCTNKSPLQDFCSEELCKEGEYCRFGKCYPECLDLPFANSQSCKCGHDFCSDSIHQASMFYSLLPDYNIKKKDVYCNLTSGCYTPEPCPQDQTIFKEGPMCDCNGTVILTNTSYCLDDESFQLPEIECPLAPDLSLSGQCICNKTLICQKESMCDSFKHGCVERPDPCSALPEVAGTSGCYCKDGHKICETGQTCGGLYETCYEPAKCLHPMFEQDWNKFLATNTTVVRLDENNFAIEGTELGIKCQPRTFREDLIASDTFEDVFSIKCSPDSSWKGLEKCKYPLCEKLKFDETVKETVWGFKEGTKFVQGAVIKLECLDEANTFNIANEVSRYFYHCDKKKWNVSDKSNCPKGENSCKEPLKVSCSFTGCLSLPEPFQDRVVYDPLMSSYQNGSSLTAFCSNKVVFHSKFTSYSSPEKYLIVKKRSSEAKLQVDTEFCLHEDCLASAGITWHGNTGEHGTDCIRKENGDAFCIESKLSRWNGTSFKLPQQGKLISNSGFLNVSIRLSSLTSPSSVFIQLSIQLSTYLF